MSIVLRITEDSLTPELERIAARVKNKMKPLMMFAEWWHARMLEALDRMTYSRLWPNGAEFRAGIFWKSPAPLRIRKRTGEKVPPWGNVQSMVRKAKGSVRKVRSYERIVRDQFGRRVDVEHITKETTTTVYARAGAVLGRKRPSGQRVTPYSRMMQDTGIMMQDFLTAPEITGDENDTITWSVVSDYAEEQNDLRTYNEFAAGDEEVFTNFYRDWLFALFQAEQTLSEGGQAA